MARHPAGPILLVGADGQTGLDLRRTLSPMGDIVPVTRREADLADPDALRRVVREHAPSLIVNAAAYNAVDRAEQEPEAANAVNTTAPGVLAEEAAKLGAALVHYSTDYVFGQEIFHGPDGHPRPFREDDPIGPLGAYGRSKAGGEDAVRAAGCAHLIFRTSWVYSRRGRTFLAALLRLEVKGEELRIVDDQASCPTWAPSLADTTALILAACWAGGGTASLRERSGTYHLCGQGWCSRYVFAGAIFGHYEARGRAVPRLQPATAAEFPMPAARPDFSALDTTRVRETFGIGLPDWRVGLSLCLAD